MSDFKLPRALAEFQDAQRWVCWRYVIVKGRRTKVPIQTNGRRAATDDPKTWATLSEAAAVRPADGVGLVLGGGLQGLDIDMCLTPDGQLEPWAVPFLDRIPTYCEVSPSRRGLKLFFRGPEGPSASATFGNPVSLGDGSSKRCEVAYSTHGRYYTVTGDVYADAPLAVIDAATADDLRDDIKRLRGSRGAPPPRALRDEGLEKLPSYMRDVIVAGVPEGERSERFHHVVLSLHERGWPASQIVATLAKYPKGIAAKFLDRLDTEVERSLSRARPRPKVATRIAGAAAVSWPDLQFPASIVAPDIPANLLPGIAGRMAGEVARATQTPEAMAVTTVLPVLATASQRRWSVQPTQNADYTEPTSVWFLCATPSGTRKTGVQSALTAPLHDFQESERKRLVPLIAQRFALRQVAERRIEKLKQDAAKTNDAAERRRLQDEIAEEKTAMPDELHAPVLVVGDITPEAAQDRLVRNGGTLSVISDEAGILQVMAGAYGDRAVKDVFLKGHAGSDVHVERMTRSAHIRRPAISMGLAVQPGVLKDLGEDGAMRESGILARFLYAFPESTVGRRDVRALHRVEDATRVEYEDRMRELLEASYRPGRVTLKFEPAATEVYYQLAEEVERELAPNGRLAQIADWGSKLPGAMARIAAILSLAKRGPDIETVEEPEAQAASRLAELLVEHALVAFGHLGADTVEADARALLRWIASEPRHTFTRAEALRSVHRFRTVERLKFAVERLQEWNAIGVEEVRRNHRARPTHWYRVHPEIAAGAISGFSGFM